MTESNDLSILSDAELMAILKEKQADASWTVRELRETHRRGFDFLSSDRELQEILRKTDREFREKISIALKPTLEELEANALVASKFSRDIQSVSDAALLSAGQRLADIAKLPPVIENMNRMADLASGRNLAKLVEPSPIFESINKMAKLATEYRFPNLLVEPSPMMDSINKMAKLATSFAEPKFISQQTQMLKYLQNNAGIAQRLSQRLEDVEQEVRSTIDHQETAKLESPEILDLVVSEPRAIAEIAKPIIHRLELDQENAILVAAQEIGKNTALASAQLGNVVRVLADGAVPRWLALLGIYSCVIGAVASIVTVIKVLWFAN